MEIAIIGEGEVVIRFIDRNGQTLLQERLVVSGPPGVQALRQVPLSIGTVDGPAELAPVITSVSTSRPRVTFDGEEPARFVRRRSKIIGCRAAVMRDAGQGAGSGAAGHRRRDDQRAGHGTRAAGRLEAHPSPSLTNLPA